MAATILKFEIQLIAYPKAQVREVVDEKIVGESGPIAIGSPEEIARFIADHVLRDLKALYERGERVTSLANWRLAPDPRFAGLEIV